MSIDSLVDTHADQVEAFVGAVADATDSFAGDLATLTAAATAGWVAVAGSTSAVPDGTVVGAFLAWLRRELARLFGRAGPIVDRALSKAVRDGVELGVRQASGETAVLSGTRTRLPVPDPSPEVLAAVATAVEHLEVQHAAARRVLAAAPSVGFPAVAGGLREAEKTVPLVERAGSWAVVRAVAEGSEAVADSLGVGRVWIAERTACVVCAAYAGVVAAQGAEFPRGLTFGAKPADSRPVPNPPKHPRCRCKTAPWSDAWKVPGVLSYPEALRREAARSIARGFALPSEPVSVRIAAAERLLADGTTLPASVRAFAARAVRSGRFPPVPAGI